MKGDIYYCYAGHRFIIIHEKPEKEVALTITCPFGCREIADYEGSVEVKVKWPSERRRRT